MALAMLASLLLVSSCIDEEPAPPPEEDVIVTVPVESAEDQIPENIVPVRVFGNLDFDLPLFLTWVPGAQGRLAVVEQEGRIKIFPNREDAGQASVLLDISDQVQSGGEEGMLGLAFDPRFEENGFFYVYYSAGGPRRSVISRFTISGADPNAAEPASEKIILEVMQPPQFGNHKAGMIAFGPDGMLYIALGDGGGSGDPQNNAQNLGTALGSILRIDPAGGDPYAIPAENPFAGQAGVRGEIWAYGFRNPYRFSFDRETGDLWAGDVGERAREEINLVTRGGNYGWPHFEGTEPFRPEGRSLTGFTGPVTEYSQSRPVSVIGGYVYHGSLAPSLRGAYVYADYYSGRIWALGHRNGQLIFNVEIASVPTISSFGEDRAGELYVVSHLSGQIYQLRQQ